MTKPRCRCLTLATFAAVVLLAACTAPPPDFTRLDGEPGRWDDWEGQWVVVNYWAEWCGPCRDEIPELNLLDERSDVTVVGINFDTPPPEETLRQSEALGIRFTVLLGNPGEARGLALPEVLPVTYILDPSGAEVSRLQGPQHREDIERAIEAARAGGVAGRREGPHVEPVARGLSRRARGTAAG